MNNITIICPTYNEEQYIAKCIESLLLQDYPLSEMEILFIDGRSTDNTRIIIQQYIEKHTNIQLLDNPHKVVPHALNIGIKASKGKVIIRVDGHCVYPSNYVSTLTRYLYQLEADNVGAVWNTMPAKDNTTCRAIAIASSHPFGVGGSKHKIGSNKIIQTDTVPFGCYRREVFDKIGLFDEDLIRNQDDEFNARLINNGGKIYLTPELVINYTARDKFNKMAKMYYQYGLFKPLVCKKLKSPATIRQFFPSLFLCGLIGGLITSFCTMWIAYLYLFILSVYILLGIIIGVKNGNRYKDYKLIFYLPFTFFLIHISYGWGYLVGIYKVITKSRISVKTNR
jgi:glycosyltransferase involved in cell wall biosynthesis